MNTKHYLDKVAEFHATMMYRQPEPTSPSLDQLTCELRVKLIQEEWYELMDAITKESPIGQLDALCDLQYVISGAALALGFRSFYVASVALCGRSDSGVSGFSIWISQFATNLFRANLPGSWGALAMLETHLHGIVRSLGFDAVFDGGFDCVHESNLTKQWTEDQMEAASGNLSFRRNANGLYVAFREDGKIMKPPTFRPPDLQPFVSLALA